MAKQPTPAPAPGPQPAPANNPNQRQQRGLGRVKSVDDIKADTLVGDVRDLVLQEMRDAKEALPWTVRTEKQQAEMIDRADRFARTLVSKVVNAVAAGNNPAVPVTIKEWKVTDELKVALVGAATLQNMHSMIDGGSIGFLVFADKEPFQGEREPVKPTPDQADLIDDGSDEDDGRPSPPEAEAA